MIEQSSRHPQTFYLEFLKEHQPNPLDDMDQEYMVGENYPTHEKEMHLQNIKLGYQHLIASSAELKALFDLIIHTIFLRKSNKINNHVAFGGSTSAGIGVIWISGYGELDQDNIAELLLHELTHHQLFIDECCHAQFNHAEISKPENFSTSDILNKRRPLDKVVHSIIVATEILLARSRFLRQQETKIHGPSEDLMNKTVTAIEETMGMANINNLLTERTCEILMRALSCLKELDSPLLVDAATA